MAHLLDVDLGGEFGPRVLDFDNELVSESRLLRKAEDLVGNLDVLLTDVCVVLVLERIGETPPLVLG